MLKPEAIESCKTTADSFFIKLLSENSQVKIYQMPAGFVTKRCLLDLKKENLVDKLYREANSILQEVFGRWSLQFVFVGNALMNI